MQSLAAAINKLLPLFHKNKHIPYILVKRTPIGPRADGGTNGVVGAFRDFLRRGNRGSISQPTSHCRLAPPWFWGSAKSGRNTCSRSNHNGAGLINNCAPTLSRSRKNEVRTDNCVKESCQSAIKPVSKLMLQGGQSGFWWPSLVVPDAPLGAKRQWLVG